MAHRNLVTIIGLWIFVLLHIGCDDENNTDPENGATDPETEIADISELENDPLFEEYLGLLYTNEEPKTRDTDSRSVMRIVQDYPDLDESKKVELALALGFDNYSDLMNYIDKLIQYRNKLEEKYKLSGYEWGILKPIYENAIKEFELLKNSFNIKTDNKCSDELKLICGQRNINCSDTIGEVTCVSCAGQSAPLFVEALEKHRITPEDLEIENCFPLEIYEDDDVYEQACQIQRIISFRLDIRIATHSYYCCIFSYCDDALDLADECASDYCVLDIPMS